MKIALFGKRFEAAYDDAVKHVLRRVLALDASPIVNGAFREELLERMDVAEQLGEYTSPEEVARIEANLTGEINKRRNPPVVPMSPPWSS